MAAPATKRPTWDQFYSKKDTTKPDIEFLKTHFTHEGRLTEEQALWIIQKGTEILKKEPNLLEVDAPITGAFSNLTVQFEPGTNFSRCLNSLR